MATRPNNASRRHAKLGYEAVGIDLFNEETLNAGQVAVGEQLRRQFGKGDTEVQ